MEIFESIIAIRNDAKSTANLVAAVVKLYENMINMHGVYAGTHQAVLAEAQGAELLDSAGQVYNHRTSLIEAGRALANREKEIEQGLTSLARFSGTLADKTRTVLRPLLQVSAESRSLIAETEAKAMELARSDPGGLRGVPLTSGGMGPGVARDQAALISNQLNAQAAALRARGAQSSLLPNPGAAQAYLYRLRQLAVNQSDSARKMGAILAAMRLALRQALAEAGAAGRALLSTVFEQLLAALELLATRLGGMLVTPLVIPTSVLKPYRFGPSEDA
jgi:hypothetical protein